MAQMKSFTPEERQAYKESKQRQREELEAKVKGLVDSFRDSDTFKTYLAKMFEFNYNCEKHLHRYSVNNLLLIVLQDPTAQLVGSATAWRRMGRLIKRGEHSHISVWAPMTQTVLRDKLDQYGNPILKPDGTPEQEIARDENGRAIRRANGRFKLEPVFDISQTDGPPLPSLTRELENPVENFEAYEAAIRKVSPFPIYYSDQPEAEGIRLGQAKGVCSYGGKNIIVVKAGMSEEHTLKTMIHETTHAKLHDPSMLVPKPGKDEPEITRNEMEVQAECTAFLVCEHFGLDTSDYSIPYIMNWGEDKKLTPFTKSVDTILSTTHDIIDQMETQLWIEMGIDETAQIKAEKAHVVKAAMDADSAPMISDSSEVTEDDILALLSNKTVASLWSAGFRIKYEPPLASDDKPLLRLEQKTEETTTRIDLPIKKRKGGLVSPDFTKQGLTTLSVFNTGETEPFFQTSEGSLVDQFRAFEEASEQRMHADDPSHKVQSEPVERPINEKTIQSLMTDDDVQKLLSVGYKPQAQTVITPEGFADGVILTLDKGFYSIQVQKVEQITPLGTGPVSGILHKNTTSLTVFDKSLGEPSEVFNAWFDAPIEDQMGALRTNTAYQALSCLSREHCHVEGISDQHCQFATQMNDFDVKISVPISTSVEGQMLDFHGGNISVDILKDGQKIDQIRHAQSVPRALIQANQHAKGLLAKQREPVLDPVSYAKQRRAVGRTLAEQDIGVPLSTPKTNRRHRDQFFER